MFCLTGHTELLSLRIKYFDHTCFHSTVFKMPFSVLLNKQVTNMHKYSCLKTIKRDGRQTTDSVLRARQHRPSAIALISWWWRDILPSQRPSTTWKTCTSKLRFVLLGCSANTGTSNYMIDEAQYRICLLWESTCTCPIRNTVFCFVSDLKSSHFCNDFTIILKSEGIIDQSKILHKIVRETQGLEVHPHFQWFYYKLKKRGNNWPIKIITSNCEGNSRFQQRHFRESLQHERKREEKGNILVWFHNSYIVCWREASLSG